MQADTPGELALNLRQKEAPWRDLSIPVLVPVGPQAKQLTLLVSAQESDGQASLPFTFYLDKSASPVNGKAYLSDVKVWPASPGAAPAH